MIKFLIVPTILLALISCETDFSGQNGQTNVNHTKQQSGVNINIIQDTMLVKKWLTKVVTEYVNSDDSKSAHDILEAVLTEDYYNYKQEAITLEYSEMNKEEFDEKWKAKYDTKYVGNGDFFTYVMDHGNVEVPVCNILESFGDTAKVFHTVIRDLRWKTDYKFDIKVVSRNNKLRIDDVKEYK